MEPTAIISWKNQTLTQIVSNYKKNGNNNTNLKQFFNPQPLKLYRKTLTIDGGVSSLSKSFNRRTTINDVMEKAGGATKTSNPTPTLLCNNDTIAMDYNDPNSLYLAGGCDATAPELCNSRNALKRVRNSGNVKPSFNLNYNQYLTTKNKSFHRNQFVYDSNCVTYKPSNAKYSNQGAISSSSFLENRKYNEIQKIAGAFTADHNVYGPNYKNSVIYGGNYSGNNSVSYTQKDKNGYLL